MCGKVELGCQIKEGFRSVVTGQFDALAAKIGETAASGLEAVGSFWMTIDTKALDEPTGGWRDAGPADYLHENVMGLVVPIFTVAVLVAGVRMAWEQRAEPLQQLLKAILTFVVVAGLGSATIRLLAAASDEFALHVVNNASMDNRQFHAALGELVVVGGASSVGTAGMPLLAAMFFGVAVFMASVVQVVLLLIRSAMLVLIAGTFPLAAAATNTELGRNWLRKYCAWSLAFLAYKPAAALVYAAAIRMTEEGVTTSSGNGVVRAMTGLMMILLAVFALPALLRFVVPVTAAVAGGSSGTGSSVADPGGLATGAVNIGRSALGRGGGGGGGSGSGGSGGGASGALGVAGAGLGAVGAGVSGAKKGAGALAGAAAHSAGEAGGGSSGASGGGGSAPAWGGRRGGSKRSTDSSKERVPEPVGPSGSD